MLAPIAVLGSLLVDAPVAVWAAPESVVRVTYDISPGVKLRTIRYPTTPNEVRILIVNTSKSPRLDVFPAGKAYPARAYPSALGAGAGAVGTVNGDFALVGDSRPAHTSMIDGELWISGVQEGEVLGIAGDGSRAFIGDPEVVVKATTFGSEMRVHTWNVGDPDADRIAAYTARGGRVVGPPGVSSPVASSPAFCAARLVPVSAPAWAGPTKPAVTRAYKVDVQPTPCPKTPLAIGSTSGAVVLAGRADGAGGAAVESLTPGNRVRLTWGMSDWAGVTDVIGGRPLLLRNGVNVAPTQVDGSYFYDPNPRTTVGIGAGCKDTDPATDCRLYILTVDGRQAATGWSKGMLLPQVAEELRKAGAVDALALDGGGGTVMWVAALNPAYCQSYPSTGGCLADRPSSLSTGERLTSVALGVLPGADHGEPSSLG